MAQSLAKIYIHAIFSTKNRDPLLSADWREELFRIIGGGVNNLGCQWLLVGGVADHIHLLFQLSRSLSIADAIGKIKTASTGWIVQTRRISSFHWQAGYAAFSVSQSNLEAVRQYVADQDKHHATQSFQDELREWLKRYEMTWDERYVWD